MDEAMLGRWVHAFEEDTEIERVFRRLGHRLPASRFRAQMEICPDHTVKIAELGGNDVARLRHGVWSAETKSGGLPQILIEFDDETMDAVLRDVSGPLLMLRSRH